MNTTTKVMDATDVIEVSTNEDVLQPQPIVKRINEQGEVNLALLSNEEKEKYHKLTQNLNTNDVNSIANYGTELQSTMARQSNDFLASVRTQQGGEIGGLIDDLLGQLSYIELDELEAPSTMTKIMRKIPILNKLVSSVEKILHKYDTIEKNVNTIAQKIQVTRLTSLRDNNALEVMFNNNLEYGKQIEDLIIAGKLKLEEIETQINDMLQHADQYESYQIQDVQEYHHALERRINDLITLRYVMKQSLVQIRTVQRNNISIADKAQSIVATTIPVWRNQLSIAVALNNQKDNIKAHRKVTETTNTILCKNAELLRTNSIETAKENERSVVSIETLRQTTQELLRTVQEVKQIHENATAKRREAEQEMLKLEKELEGNMVAIGNQMRYIKA